jgi:hypothetical protein
MIKAALLQDVLCPTIKYSFAERCDKNGVCEGDVVGHDGGGSSETILGKWYSPSQLVSEEYHGLLETTSY